MTPVITIRIFCLLFLIIQVGTQSNDDDGMREYGISTPVHPVTLTCPGLWSIFENTNGSSKCSCGSELNHVVRCDEKTLQVKLLPCFCMTQYVKNPNITVVGACMYRCRLAHGLPYNPVPNTTSELSMHMCNAATAAITGLLSWNRDGQLCGKCHEGFAPPAYSYDWSCVECSDSKHSVINSIVKYCVIAFLPLTAFFFMMVTLRISATSPSMNAFMLACQVLTAPLLVRVALSCVSVSPRNLKATITVRIVLSLYGFWNLDFFRTLYPPFCLNPNMNSLHILALDYIVAAYPLLLLLITYSLVELHGRNCKIMVWLWKPFRRCFIRIQRTYIQTSLIDAFASFLLLSYVKFLSVSFDLLIPVHLYDVHGASMEPYLYFDGTVEYFGKQHLPYAVLAITVLIIFNVLPLLLLCLYPCRCFQKVLNYCGLRCQALHIFMDAFHNGYKNGTEGTRDYRYLSVAYLLMRIFCFIIAALTLTSVIMTYFIVGVQFAVFAILISILKPYKVSRATAVDVVLNLAVSIFSFSAVANQLGGIDYRFFANTLAGGVMVISGSAPLFYITMLILKKWWRFLKLALLKGQLRLNNSEGYEIILPEPFEH